MGRPRKNPAVNTRVVRLLDGPPKKSLADLGITSPPPSDDEEDDTPASPRAAQRVVNGIKIDAGIPLPHGRGGPPKLAAVLHSMNLHDSFLMPGAKTASSVQGAKKHVPGKKFLCRKVDGGVRCWRVE